MFRDLSMPISRIRDVVEETLILRHLLKDMANQRSTAIIALVEPASRIYVGKLSSLWVKT